MKKIILFLIFPFLTFAQIEKTIKLKVAVVQEIVKKGILAETEFWQTKGKVTFAIVNYTDEQNPVFKDLFIKQFQEILPVYNKMIVSYDEKDTALFVKILIRQEDDYRNLLTKPQLQLYLNKLADFEKNNPQQNDAYSSLFFSEKLLKEYKFKFNYNEKTTN